MKKLVNTLLVSSLLASQAMATGKVDFVTHPNYFADQNTKESTKDPIGGAITHGSKGGLKKELDSKERDASLAEEKPKEDKAKEGKATVHGSKGGLQKELEHEMDDNYILRILDFLRKQNSRLAKPDPSVLEPNKGEKLEEEESKKKYLTEADKLPEVKDEKCDDKVGGFAIANLLKLKSP